MSARPKGDAYEPRQSANVPHDIAQADGQVWTERLAVCEGVTTTGQPKLVVRSYYRNSRTKERVWDEPPSGASEVRHATADMRKIADAQMHELQLTLDMLPSDEEKETEDKPKKKKGLLGRLRKKKETPVLKDDSKDLNLQRAIARSMADQRGGGSGEPVIYYDPEDDANTDAVSPKNDQHHDEEEALAMAKALSLSELPQQNVTEEEMLHRALEESRRHAELVTASAGVASMPQKEGDLLSMGNADTSPPPTRNKKEPPTTYKKDPNEDKDLEQKIPTEPTLKPPPAATNKTAAFDPYAASETSLTEKTSNVTPAAAAAAGGGGSPPPPVESTPKIGSDEDHRKTGRTIARHVFGNKKKMEDQAGVV